MTPRFPQLREDVADAITFHPGNRTGTPEQRHPVSLTLADAVLRVVRPCTCDGDPIECSHEAARGEAEAAVARVEKLCRDIEMGASAMRVDPPHWIASVRAALCAPHSPAEPVSPASTPTEATGGAREAQEGRDEPA